MNSTTVITKLGESIKEYRDDIDKYIALIERYSTAVNNATDSSAGKKICELPGTTIPNPSQDNPIEYTPEAIIAKLGRDGAESLAKSIITMLSPQ